MPTKQVKLGKESEIRIIWNVSSVEHSAEKENEIRSKFASKYGISESQVHVEPNFINKNTNGEIALNGTIIESVNDPKFHQSLFEQYLKERGIEDYDIDALIAIDGQINSQIDFDSYEKGRRYKLKWVDWSNFLSYGPKNHFDFTDLHGLVLLNGVPSNQSGKSTFAYDLLHFLFFGKTSSGKADILAKYFNNKLPKETKLKAEGCIEIDGVDYIIRRTLTRPELGKSKNRSVTQKVEYFRVKDGGNLENLNDEECLNGENSVMTTKAIKEAIGNERDFDLVISANSDNLKQLISLQDTERGRLLSRWIGLLPIEDKDVKAREKWNKEISQNRYITQYNRETLKSDITSYKEAIVELEKQNKEDKKKTETLIKEIEYETKIKEGYISQKKDIDTSLAQYDVATLKNRLQDVTEKGKRKSEEKKEYDRQVESFGEIFYSDTDYKKKLAEKDKITARNTEIKVEINNLKNAIQSLRDGEYCPVCHRKFDGADNSSHIKENEDKITELIKQGTQNKTRLDELNGELSVMDDARTKFIEKNRLELRSSACQVDIQNLRNEYKELSQLIQNIQSNYDAIENNSRLDSLINVCNDKISTRQSSVYTLNSQFANRKSTIEANEKQIKENERIIAKINEEEITEKNWKTYLMLIGKDGISKMILRNAIPIINRELKRLLDGVCDFDVEVSINDRNDVEFYLITDGVRQDLCAGSGFEQTAAALALRVVLGNMSSLSKPPFILLDEILGGVASDNYENVKKLYDRIIPYYQFILHITHLTNLGDDFHDMVVTVKKDEKKISHIAIAE